VIEIETEAPDFERLPAALVLPSVDPRVEYVEDLVIAREKRPLEDFGIAAVDCRLNR
jgi:hypothetical protein